MIEESKLEAMLTDLADRSLPCLAAYFSRARNLAVSSPERLAARRVSVEATLAFGVAILLPYLRWRDLPLPQKELERLESNLAMPSLGLWSHVFEALAKSLSGDEQAAADLPFIRLISGSDSPPNGFRAALGKLADERNGLAHDQHGMALSESEASARLDRLREPYFTYLDALQSLLNAPIFGVWSQKALADGRRKSDILIGARGQLEPSDFYSFPEMPRGAYVLAGRGRRMETIPLHPFLYLTDKGIAGTQHILLLEQWQDSATPGLRYRDPGNQRGFAPLQHDEQTTARRDFLLVPKDQVLGWDCSSLSKLEQEAIENRLLGGSPSIPGYQPIERLHTGTLGSTYLVTRTSRGEHGVGKEIAKLADAARESPKRLLQKLSSRVFAEHPALVTPRYLTSATKFTLVRELVTGQSYAGLLDGQALDFPSVLDRYTAVVRAVAEMHSAKKIHGNLKPSNIYFGDDGRVRLVDAGLGTSLRGLVERAAETHDEYSAPEVRQKPCRPDPRHDVWSLGLLLRNSLLAFRAEAAVPDRRALWALARRATQESQEARLETARQLADELERAVTITPPSAELLTNCRIVGSNFSLDRHICAVGELDAWTARGIGGTSVTLLTEFRGQQEPPALVREVRRLREESARAGTLVLADDDEWLAAVGPADELEMIAERATGHRIGFESQGANRLRDELAASMSPHLAHVLPDGGGPHSAAEMRSLLECLRVDFLATIDRHTEDAGWPQSEVMRFILRTVEIGEAVRLVANGMSPLEADTSFVFECPACASG